MKFWFSILFLFFSFIANGNSKISDTFFIVTAEKLNVRAGPGINYSKIARLSRNDTIRPIAVGNKDWIAFKISNKSVYVSRKYLKEVIIEKEETVKKEKSGGFFSKLISLFRKMGKLKYFITVVILVFILRYALRLIEIIDRKFINYRSGKGLPFWLIRIINVTIVFFGTIFNTYFHFLLGKRNNRNPAIWPVKAMIIISLFLLIPLIFNNALVNNYLNGNWFIDNTFSSMITEARFWTWYLYILTLLLLFLVTVIITESIKKTGPYALIRIPVILILLLMAGIISLMFIGFSITILLILFILSLFGIVSLERFKPDYEADLVYNDQVEVNSQTQAGNKKKFIREILKQETHIRDQQYDDEWKGIHH